MGFLYAGWRRRPGSDGLAQAGEGPPRGGGPTAASARVRTDAGRPVPAAWCPLRAQCSPLLALPRPAAGTKPWQRPIGLPAFLTEVLFSGKTPPSFRLTSPSSSAGVSLRPGVGPSQPSLHHFAGLATARGLGRLRGRSLPAGQAGAGPGGLATQAWVGSGSGSQVRTGTEDPMRASIRSFSQPLGRLESPASELPSPPEPLPSCSLWIHHFLCLVCSLSFFTSFLFCNVTSLPSSSS